MSRYFNSIFAILLAALLILILYTHAITSSIDELEGRIRESNDHAAHLTELLAGEMGNSRERLQEAERVAEAERGLRESLSREIDAVTARNGVLQRRIETAESDHQEVIAAIPDASDRELAQETEGLLQEIRADAAFELDLESGWFRANRAAAEAIQAALLEVQLLEFVSARQAQHITGLQQLARALDQRARSFSRELSAERRVKGQLLSEIQSRAAYENQLRHQVDLLRDQNDALKSRSKWGSAKDWILLGLLDAVLISSGDERAYGAAAGATGFMLLRKAF